MFITRESDYAVRIIRELSDGSMKTVKEICDKESIPLQFAYKILKKMEKGSLVLGFRGVKGGYRLGRDPQHISLYDILICVEDNVYINQCLNGSYECPRNLKDNPCLVHSELRRLQNTIFDLLKEKTMAEILRG